MKWKVKALFSAPEYRGTYFTETDYFSEWDTVPEVKQENQWNLFLSVLESPTTNHVELTWPHDQSPQAYIKPWSSNCAASKRSSITFWHFFFSMKNNWCPGILVSVSRTPDFSSCGNINLISDTFSDQNLESMARGRSRQRSRSYYNLEDIKTYGVDIQTEKTCLRPRSRYVLN